MNPIKIVAQEVKEVVKYQCPECDFTDNQPYAVTGHYDRAHSFTQKDDLGGIEVFEFKTEDRANAFARRDRGGEVYEWTGPGWYCFDDEPTNDEVENASLVPVSSFIKKLHDQVGTLTKMLSKLEVLMEDK